MLGKWIRRPKRLKLGIVANEFFDEQLGRMGGFGWAAMRVAQFFKNHQHLGIDPVFLTGEMADDYDEEVRVHDTPLIRRRSLRRKNWLLLRASGIDLFLTIDYRPDYSHVLSLLPRTPVLFWVRDPRPPDDIRKIDTLRVPNKPHDRPAGIATIDCTSFARIAASSKIWRRKIIFCTTALSLKAKIPGTYGVEPENLELLPNIIDELPLFTKTKYPRVLFLGRLDPIKRPWMFVELGKHLPHVEFLFLGKSHFAGHGTWEPTGLPPNVRLMGHMGEREKLELLGSSWALVNTSIHEALPVSFLESLACGTPIVSCQDPENVVSRFGQYVGRIEGDGLAAVPAFADALKRVLGDHELRDRLGNEGRNWVRRVHSGANFLQAFFRLCMAAGRVCPGGSSRSFGVN